MVMMDRLAPWSLSASITMPGPCGPGNCSKSSACEPVPPLLLHCDRRGPGGVGGAGGRVDARELSGPSLSLILIMILILIMTLDPDETCFQFMDPTPDPRFVLLVHAERRPAWKLGMIACHVMCVRVNKSCAAESGSIIPRAAPDGLP